MSDASLDDVLEQLGSIHQMLGDLLDELRSNTAAANKWGAEIESRLSYIEGNTAG